VVVSNAAALPEVAGDAALLCDATDPDAIADAVSKVLDDAELRGSLIAKGRRRAAAYSWERTGSETLRVYEEVHQALHSRHRARSKGRAA
jgi:alpha-1,3-rhamnosyl/mannosyltransferase